MLNKYFKFSLIGLGLSLAACGQKYEAKKSSYTYENPNTGIAVQMRPTSDNAVQALKTAHNIEFLEPKIEVSTRQKTVRFQVIKVTDGKSESIELKGNFDEQFHVWMTDTSPVNGMNRLKAFAYCLDSTSEKIDCSNMFIELHFKHQGKEIKHQLEVSPLVPITNEVDKHAEDEKDSTLEGSQETEENYDTSIGLEEAEELANEGVGDENTNGSYVVAPPDEKYWDNIQALLKQQSESEFLPATHSILDLTNAAKFIQAATTNSIDEDVWTLRLTDGGRAKGSYSSLYNSATKKNEYGRIVDTSTQVAEVGLCHTKYGDSQKAFATGYAADFIQESTCTFKEKYKQCDLVDIGNLSNADGGRLRFNTCVKTKKGTVCYHKSHQNGLEYDIDYQSQTCNYEYFKIVANAKNQLGLPVAHSILVEPSIKQALCAHAKSRKLKSNEDKRLFEVLYSYPRHNDHSHIRLKCSPGHVGCWQQDTLVDKRVSCRL
jgi:Penicillin-insensitive murein endopeptidase